MTILGIGIQHDAGAAVIRDGRVLAAVNEERLNRKKMFWGLPERAIPEAMRLAGVEAKELDAVAVANTTYSTYAANWEGLYPKDLKRRALIRLSKMGLARAVGGNRPGVDAYRALNSKRVRFVETARFEAFLRELGIPTPVTYVDHHEAHLASAYYTCGWDDCLSLSLDGVGDGHCSRIAVCREGRMRPYHRIPFYHTPGQYYSFVTGWAGFTPGKHEGKITGLAAYGNPEAAIDIFRKRLSYSPRRFSFINHGMWGWAEYEHLCRRLDGIETADVAAAVQVHLEDVVTQYVRQAVERTGVGRIALSGGIFANVKLNQRIRDLDGVDDVFIHPHMSDGGLAVGSALALNARRASLSPSRLENVYLGSDLEDADIRKALRDQGLTSARPDNVEDEIAYLLAQGCVVARVSGPMEYGPRALGNRSILYQATDVTVNDWLNKRLKRTEFMPFAPAVTRERAGEYYVGYPASDHAAEFMTITYDATDRCAEEAPATVHVDGTARPQVVSKLSNPSFHRILQAYERLTGLRQVINTSFNMHEEPIVCSAADAVRAFQLGHLDVLAIGAHIVHNPKGKRRLNGEAAELLGAR
jgi:carbamoyltransferase